MKYTLATALAAVVSAQLTQTDYNFKTNPQIDAAILDSSNVPFSNHSASFPFGSYVIQNLNFTLVKPVFDYLNATIGGLKTRGEAHITVIQPPEFDDTLKGFLTMDQVNKIVLDNNLQSTPFKIVCLGHSSQIDDLAVGVRHNVYNLIVESTGLVQIRRKVYDAFVAAGGDPSNFNPDDFLPHITVGYDERDWFEADNVYKTKHTCIKDIDIIGGKNPSLTPLDEYVEAFPTKVAGTPFKISKKVLDASNVPFTAYNDTLVQTLDKSLLAPVFAQLSASVSGLKPVSSAVIPIFSSFEFIHGLNYVLSIDKINEIAKKMNIQSAKFEIACVAKQSGSTNTGKAPFGTPRHSVYDILVKSDDLHNIRKAVYDAYLAAGGPPSNFNPDDFLPFINVAFDSDLGDLLERDLVFKHYKTCIAPVELVDDSVPQPSGAVSTVPCTTTLVPQPKATGYANGYPAPTTTPYGSKPVYASAVSSSVSVLAAMAMVFAL
ncbi:hypothetical protein HK103_001769 [Boothiomyces macroporosus]|uniref:Swiss Army Knife 2H phosphoesterase domain-containing protein n=1 Tax=Boothiomyces macroporosus TaxID=261099 RepID=A0AAD5UA83_9FUNG|nr:hypothetical protein HK103_001769 [Boothiomyces macroporosus]